MNTKRFIMAVVASFVFLGAFQWLYHGVLMMDAYEATASMWRPMPKDGGMTQYCYIMMTSNLLVSFMVAYIFTLHYEKKGMAEGVRFGLYIGLLLAALNLGAYSYLPMDFPMAAAWMLGSLLSGLGMGVVLAAVSRK